MEWHWDTAKAPANRVKHGVSFSAILEADWNCAVEWLDDRADYGEARVIALLPIGPRLHVAVYTTRAETCRLISLRRANRRELAIWSKIYDEEAETD